METFSHLYFIIKMFCLTKVCFNWICFTSLQTLRDSYSLRIEFSLD